MMSTMFKDEAKEMLKAQNEAESKVITKLEESVEYMKLTENIVKDYQAVYDVTEESYAKLNASGQIKPQHKLKAQVEKLLGMIAAEETNSYEKAKIAMMADSVAKLTGKGVKSWAAIPYRTNSSSPSRPPPHRPRPPTMVPKKRRPPTMVPKKRRPTSP
mmetsp:Transcript_27353/g.57307  ORF Transcript_27353/g.57307 Transcript_27353/m.57307 type:complete len:159 (+) Transcript_27353:1647-2123(+)